MAEIRRRVTGYVNHVASPAGMTGLYFVAWCMLHDAARSDDLLERWTIFPPRSFTSFPLSSFLTFTISVAPSLSIVSSSVTI